MWCSRIGSGDDYRNKGDEKRADPQLSTLFQPSIKPVSMKGSLTAQPLHRKASGLHSAFDQELCQSRLPRKLHSKWRRSILGDQRTSGCRIGPTCLVIFGSRQQATESPAQKPSPSPGSHVNADLSTYRPATTNVPAP